MTPDDLLAAVRARLDAIERIAQQVADRYVTARDGHTVWPLPTVRARFRDRDPGIAAGLTLIEMCNPDAVLRRVAADRRILAEHSPHDHGACPVCWHVTPESSIREIYPCPTLTALADGLGIDLEETSDD